MKKLILDTIADAIIDLLYYDRKEDNELPLGKIEESIRDGEVSMEEILCVVRDMFINRVWGGLKNE